MSSENPKKNPYSPQFAAPLHPPTKRPIVGQPVVRKVKLGFFEPFFESLAFMEPSYWFFWLLCFVAAIIASVIPFVLIGPMYCGLGLCFLAKKRGDPFDFDLLFKGFDHFVATLVPVLIYAAMSLVIVPVIIVGVFAIIALISTGNGIAVAVGIMALVTIYISFTALVMVLSYGIFFSSFLVAEYELDGMDAFKISFDGLKQNFFGMLAVGLAGAILSIAGAILCYIPLMLMVPMLFAGPFICYQKIFTPGGNPVTPKPMSPSKPIYQ